MLTLLALIAALVWAGLLLFRDGFWRPGPTLAPAAADTRRAWPAVAVLVPARDEAATIGRVVDGQLSSTYPGPVQLVVLDDDSRDGTGAILAGKVAGAARPVEVIAVPPLPAGWSGKLFALHSGLGALARIAPDARYVLFTDADILHGPDSLERLVEKAEAEDLALVSVMAALDCRGFWAKLLVPAFVFFFQKLYPFPAVNEAARATAAGAGGCMLIRRDALEATGGLVPMRGALIDDCTLAARLKAGPPRRPIWLGFSDAVTSLRDNRGLGSIWSMVSRNAFTQLGHSALFLAGTVAGMGLAYLAAPAAFVLGLATGDLLAAGLGAAGWTLMALAYRPTCRLYGLGAPWAFTLPLAGLLYTAMTVSSALDHWRGRGSVWKGRRYGPAPARKDSASQMDVSSGRGR